MNAKLSPQINLDEARQEMLDAPCPYCSNPKKFQRKLDDKGREDHKASIARVGKFWKRSNADKMLTVASFDHGDYFRIPIGGKHFIKRFKNFELDILGFEARYSAWAFASDSLLFNLTTAPGDIARHSNFSLNVARVTHKKCSVVIDAHTWFSHGTILTVHHVPKELSSMDINVIQEALEFFRPETRGAPKIKRAEMWKAIDRLGEGVTQKQLAAELSVGESTVRDWLKREGMEWPTLKLKSY